MSVLTLQFCMFLSIPTCFQENAFHSVLTGNFYPKLLKIMNFIMHSFSNALHTLKRIIIVMFTVYKITSLCTHNKVIFPNVNITMIILLFAEYIGK